MFHKLLEEKRAEIIKQWFTVVVESYPEETARFLKSQKNPFANPVGRAVKKGVEDLFDELLGGLDREKASACLDPIIRIRAIQNFTPSKATAFIFSLKSVLRSTLKNELERAAVSDELADFETRIDRLGLIAFDVYMACREKIYEIKSNEFKKRYYSAFRRAGLVSEVPGELELG